MSGDARDYGFVGALPPGPAFEVRRILFIMGDPDRVALGDLRGEVVFQKRRPGIDDRFLPIVVFYGFEPLQGSFIQEFSTSSAVEGLDVQHRREILEA